MNQDKLEEILNMVRSVPTLPEAAQELSRLAGDPTASAQDMANVAETDSGLATQILRVVNSSFFGFSRQIKTIPQAIVVLGTHGLRNIAVGLAVTTLRPKLTKTPVAFDVDDFWRHSLSVAIAARLLSKQLASCDPDEAFLAGLLHDIGKLILIESLTEQYETVLTMANSQNQPLHILEEQVFGFNHADVGFALCERWKIPESVADTVRHHHQWNSESPILTEQDQLLFLVNTANSLSKVAGIGFSGNKYMTPLSIQSHFAGRTLEDSLQEVLQTLPAEVTRTEHLFHIKSKHIPAQVSESAGNCVGFITQHSQLYNTIHLLLLSQGIQSVTAKERIPSGAVMTAVITDADTTPESLPRNWCSHIVVCHAADFMNHTTPPCEDQVEIDIEQLRNWLNTQLPVSVPEEIAS